MNNKFLFSIGLILVAIIGFGCVSAADAHNSTMSETPSVTVEQQQTVDMIQNQNEIINTEKAAKEDVESSQIKVICSPNNKIEQDSNVTIQTNDTNNKTTTNSTKPKLDIKGPKINNTPLNIKGPKGPINIEPSQKTKDIFRIAKYFEENSWINLRHSVIDAYELTAGSHYTLWEIAEIAARAHNIAFHRHKYPYAFGEVTTAQAFEIIKHETWYNFKPRE